MKGWKRGIHRPAPKSKMAPSPSPDPALAASRGSVGRNRGGLPKPGKRVHREKAAVGSSRSRFAMPSGTRGIRFLGRALPCSS